MDKLEGYKYKMAGKLARNDDPRWINFSSYGTWLLVGQTIFPLWVMIDKKFIGHVQKFT